ncbi:hypothetical protein A9Q88_09160 [Gammaproteobacteria bacterium 50_400_T64]|nr:hypothetical protein A9Q88_09160 [Gammaproteobacteria bacterium 50_400_T64]
MDFLFALPLLLLAWWALCLILLGLWKRTLFQQTWREPYFADIPILFESDDWGPGGLFHIERLNDLLSTLKQQPDSQGRSAVLTANMVLAVPDIEKSQGDNKHYHRLLLDQGFPELSQAFQSAAKDGSFVPQLHGMEHYSGEALVRLQSLADPRTTHAFSSPGWWDWESLDSPLQGHYVDGGALPTQAISRTQASNIIKLATAHFERLFGVPSYSTVAPCYLWNSEIEDIWFEHGIQSIQTAGYRCTGRDSTGHYHQDKPLIRPGEHNPKGQTYLVRNVMFEPTDGNTNADTAWAETRAAIAQALPVSISTHRYNFTRSEAEHRDSLAELDVLLQKLNTLPHTRFLSSPELAQAIEAPHSALNNPFSDEQSAPLKRLKGLSKVAAFLSRLQHRHAKLGKLSILTGLALPARLIQTLAGKSTVP